MLVFFKNYNYNESEKKRDWKERDLERKRDKIIFIGLIIKNDFRKFKIKVVIYFFDFDFFYFMFIRKR